MKNNKNIAIFINSIQAGGAERVLINYVNFLSDKNLSIDLIVLKDIGGLSEISNENVNIINLNKKKLSFAVPKIILLLKKKKYSSILTSLPHFNIILIIVKKLFFINSKLIIREANIEYNNYTKNQFNSFFFNFLKKLTYNFADEIIVISKFMKKSLIENLNIKSFKINVIYNPICKEDNKDEITIKKNWFEDIKKVPIILSIGRLERQKNYSLLIRAIYELNKSIQARLLIIGTGSEKNQLVKLIKDLNLEEKICIIDYVKNPISLIKKVNLFVSTSLWEGGPNVLFEALQSQTNIVCADYPSALEFLENGKYGEIFKNNNINDLINKLKISLSNKNKKNINTKWKEFTQNNFKEYYKLMI